MEIKQKTDWHGNFNAFASPGDYVDEAIVEHFRECVPPTTNTLLVVQSGEPYDDNDNGETFTTFHRDDIESAWQYMGHCNRIFPGDIVKIENGRTIVYA